MPFLSKRTLNRDKVRQLVTFVAIASTFLINLWSNLFPIGGENIGELSNSLFGEVLIIPANYAFIIWGLIYVALFMFAAYQRRPAQSQNPRFRQGGYWLVAACVAQNVWVGLFLFRQFAASVIAMAAILVCLAVYYLCLNVGTPQISRQERWRAQIPISIYMGWISVATIVNVAIALYHAQWSRWGLSDMGWTIILMGIAALLGIWLLLERSDTAFTLVLVWAFVAIALDKLSQPLIAGVGFSLSTVLLIFSIWRFSKKQSLSG
ncbi:MAG: hypothetical protein WBA57_10200 [Elainellaceae cyanobacterium]